MPLGKGMQDLESAPLYLAFSLASGQIFLTLSQSLQALGLGAHSPVPGAESSSQEPASGPSIRTSGRLGEKKTTVLHPHSGIQKP